MDITLMIIIAVTVIAVSASFWIGVSTYKIDTFNMGGGFFAVVIFPTILISIICGLMFFTWYEDDAKKEQIVTVVEKTDSISADANIEIKPIMIKGSLYQPIPNKEIKNVMRIYDGEKTYVISVDKATYNQYGVNSKMIIDASDDFRLEIK